MRSFLTKFVCVLAVSTPSLLFAEVVVPLAVEGASSDAKAELQRKIDVWKSARGFIPVNSELGISSNALKLHHVEGTHVYEFTGTSKVNFVSFGVVVQCSDGNIKLHENGTCEFELMKGQLTAPYEGPPGIRIELPHAVIELPHAVTGKFGLTEPLQFETIGHHGDLSRLTLAPLPKDGKTGLGIQGWIPTARTTAVNASQPIEQ